MFVTKLNPDGSLNYSTYFGGTTYSYGVWIAIDTTSAAYITGDTFSNNFPTLNAIDNTFNGGDKDGFVAKLKKLIIFLLLFLILMEMHSIT